MAPPLATTEDLQARGIDTSNTARVEALLAAASAAIRNAAGAAITQTTMPVVFPAPRGRRLILPYAPTSVSTVEIDGETVTDWSFVGDSLWRWSWQASDDLPSQVTVTLTFGLAKVPADIVDLVCNLVGAGLSHAESGYESNVGKEAESIDDYRISYTQGEEAVVSTMELPSGTRRMLASRFGGTASMVEVRS